MPLITPAKIEKKLQRLYNPFLQAWLKDELLPYELSAGKSRLDNYAILHEALDQLKAHQKKYGYQIETVVHQSRKQGKVTLPNKIIIVDETVFLRLCGRKPAEYKHFQEDVALIRQILPQLEAWLFDNPQQVIKYHGDWSSLLDVCQYFLANPRPQLYIRELPVAVHTKFVENHSTILKSLFDYLLPDDAIDLEETNFELRYGLKYDEKQLIRLRFLDKSLLKRIGSIVSDISVRPSELREADIFVEKCLIVENKMTFLALPDMPDTLAIWGHGFEVSLLKDIKWLGKSDIYYWGDLDTYGFQILSQIRGYYPHTISIMMDEQTLHTYERFIVQGKKTPVKSLAHLMIDEAFLFQYLLENDQRLEQEHIHHDYILLQLQQIKRRSAF